jgi:uncharacterized protein with HEPN domain
MRSDADRLSDILKATAKIGERVTGTIDAFQADEMLQVWAIHHLQVIGEAARGVSQSLKERHPEVPWPQIVALRNILVHEYFGLNMHQVWTMIQKDIPNLEEHVKHIRSRIAPESGCGA